MENADVTNCRALIASILNKAIQDAVSVKNPHKIKYKKASLKKLMNPNYVPRDSAKLAVHARRFINKNNFLFQTYALMLDIDPEYLSEKIRKEIKRVDLKAESIDRFIVSISLTFKFLNKEYLKLVNILLNKRLYLIDQKKLKIASLMY